MKIFRASSSLLGLRQGRKKVIVFSATSTSDLKFIEDPNRLDVAFTRAKSKLIFIGNPKPIMEYRGLLARFIEYVKNRGAFYNV